MQEVELSPGDSRGRTLFVEYYRSEMLNARCVAVSEELWPEFVNVLKYFATKIECRELPEPFGVISDYHKARLVIDSVFSVQGLKHERGANSLPAIERLVSEYARLK